MIAVALGRWSYAAGEFFVRYRIYCCGRWTPFVRVKWRHGWFIRNSTYQSSTRELEKLRASLAAKHTELHRLRHTQELNSLTVLTRQQQLEAELAKTQVKNARLSRLVADLQKQLAIAYDGDPDYD